MGHLQAQGLSVVDMDGRVALWHGGSVVATILQLTFLQLSEGLMALAGVTAQDLGALDALLSDPEFAFMSQLTVASRPGSAPHRGDGIPSLVQGVKHGVISRLYVPLYAFSLVGAAGGTQTGEQGGGHR